MAERVYLEWTVENWITVLLMTFVGLFAVGLIASAVRTYRGGGAGGGKIASPSSGTAAGGE